ncbi:MAG TPA: hypothetical protein VF775_03475 [Geobacteraceae bacterium]
MTIAIGILGYCTISAGIVLFFRFVRSADREMREATLEAAELHPAPSMPRYHRQSA